MVDSLELLSSMAKAVSFPDHQLAALVTSKLYFHLGDLDQSVEYAMMAGDHFELQVGGEFVEIILTKAVEKYISARQTAYPCSARFADTQGAALQQLELLVEKLSEQCLLQEQFIQVIGISIEARRLDILERTILAPKNSDQKLGLLYYCVDAALQLPLPFQHDLLRFILVNLSSFDNPDYVTISDCLLGLKDEKGLIALLQKLVAETEISYALQICFNISDSADSKLKELIINEFKGSQILCDTLSGDTANLLRLHYLSHSNASDLLILDRSRTQFNPGNSMFHSAISLANGIMHSGTTNDEFIRKNMDWLSTACNWSKFTAISSLGSIYRGHRQQSRHLLSQYLPKAGVTGSEFSEAGALFALGLIHGGNYQDKWVLEYIMDILKSSGSEVLLHGCLYGIGVAGIGSQREDLVEEVKAILFGDNAIAGEAAAMCIGLLKVGSDDLKLSEELLRYARETKHDKITRSCALAVALIHQGHSGRTEMAIELLSDQDGWIRFAGVWLLSLANTGNGNRVALKNLLSVAVSDANQDVRRVAVIGMAFVVIGQGQKELPEMLRLLLESYNPHLRFGSLIALGIGFAGTADAKVLDMIDPLMRSDKVDYVRQAAMIAASMILMQHSEKATDPIRRHLERIIGTKHEEALAKFGALLSQGILDAGGRNQCIALSNPNGSIDPLAVIGMALFCQFWFWYPNLNFLSLALRPTGLIACTATVKAPKMTATCHARQSLFAYPSPLKGENESAPVKLVTAVLSTAVNSPGMSPVNVEEVLPVVIEEMEADSFTSYNFNRVTSQQAKHLVFDNRFRPVSRFHPRSITVVKDSQPGQSAEYFELIDPLAEQPK